MHKKYVHYYIMWVKHRNKKGHIEEGMKDKFTPPHYPSTKPRQPTLETTFQGDKESKVRA